jgi:hypothetical protein
VTRTELTGIAAVTLGLAAVGLWRSLEHERGHERVTRPDARAVVDAPPASDQEPVAPPERPSRSRAVIAAVDNGGSAPSEASLMARLRDVKNTDPALAVDLAREGNRRFPEGTDAPERASILIHALATLQRPSEARGQAEDMVNRYPDTEWVREVERFTGAHRHRNLRLSATGAIESY